MIADSEYDKLEFNPKAIRSEKQLNGRVSTPTMLEFYSKLQNIKSFMQFSRADRDQVIKYIVYLYDPDSPLKEHYKNLEQRKEAAIKEAGFDGKKETRDKLNRMIDLRDEKVLPLIIDYLAYKNNLLWSNIVASEQAHSHYARLIMQKPADADEAKKAAALLKVIDELADDIPKYYRKLFGGDDKIAELAMKREKVSFDPESVAEQEEDQEYV